MSSCLICQENSQMELSFKDLFLLKKEEDDLCSSCHASFEQISQNHCPKCFKSGWDKVCQDCQHWLRNGFEVQHSSLYKYNQAMKDYFSQYKFQGDYYLRFAFAKLIKRELKSYEKTHQLIPIPISQNRLSKRGFNQVTGFLEAAGISYHNLLEKEETREQTSKTRSERLKMQQAFSIKNQADLASKVLLIDDVYTTGTTLQLAKICLQTAGVREIQTFSLAR